MKQSNPICKYITMLVFVLLMSACQIQEQVYETRCVDNDTSVDNDIPKEGILWKLSTNQLQNIMSMVEKTPYKDIYLMNDITTCELEIDKVAFRGMQCKIFLNAGSYGYAQCSNGEKYDFGCYKEKCAQYFPFPYIDQENELLEDSED